MQSLGEQNKSNAQIFINQQSVFNSDKFKKRIDDYICEHKLNWEIVTNNTDNYIDKLRDAVDDNVGLIIIAGGDGTISAAAAAIAGSGSALGILPLGTGNDFARKLGIPRDLTKSMDLIRQGKVQLCDLGTFNGKHFINVAGAGFDADVLVSSLRFKKKFIPKSVAYLIATLYTALTLKGIEADIEFVDAEDNTIKINEKILMISFGNGSYIGGGMNVTPKAEIDDGLLDLCLVRDISRLRFYSIFPSVFKGDHILPKYQKYIYYNKFKRLKMTLEREVNYQLDGDIYSGENTFEIEIIPNGIKLII